MKWLAFSICNLTGSLIEEYGFRDQKGGCGDRTGGNRGVSIIAQGSGITSHDSDRDQQFF